MHEESFNPKVLFNPGVRIEKDLRVETFPRAEEVYFSTPNESAGPVLVAS